MKRSLGLLGFLVLFPGAPVMSAAQFQNLDFESPILPLVPIPGDPFMRVPIGNALPYWQGYVGGIQQTSVFYINKTLGSASLDLLSRDVGDFVLQGNYTVLLYSSISDVSISQFGHIPADARSLRFVGGLSYVGPPPFPSLDAFFGVFIDGHRLAVTDAFYEPDVYNYSADISAFAGTDATLLFTGLSLRGTEGVFLDNITFSSQPVPEPSALAILALGGVLAFLVLRRGFSSRCRKPQS